MRVLFDQSAPYDLARYLEGHSVATAEECGWDRLTNGDLLATAEKDGFDLFLTRQKHPLPVKPFRPQDCSYRSRQLSLATCSFAYR
jgi:hypothetical protein